MTPSIDRRGFLHMTTLGAATVTLAHVGFAQQPEAKKSEARKLYEISLAQWSLNQQFFSFLGNRRGGNTEKLDPQDFAIIAKRDFGIDAVEYVNQFYTEAVNQSGYVQEMKKKADDAGVANVLIMCDGEGDLGDPDKKRRLTSVRNHIKWLEWAQVLGCHSIRVNARSDGKLSYAEQAKLAADGLRRLSEIGDTYELNVIVENHGGLSSHGRWLREVMETVDHPRCGTLPDFGNFRGVVAGRGRPRRETETPVEFAYGPLDYDRYLGVYELMPYAKGVSAKTFEFDDEGNETSIDYERIMAIVCDPQFNFTGHVGIEFEGGGDAVAGIKKTKVLLERIREQFSA